MRNTTGIWVLLPLLAPCLPAAAAEPIRIDTKNLLDSSRLRAMGFQYMGVGRS